MPVGEPHRQPVLAALDDLRDGRDLDEPAFAQDAGTPADGGDLAQVVRRQQHGRAALGGLADQLERRLSHQRVEPRRRLVEDEHVRLVLECVDQRHLLAVALGQIAHTTAQVEVEPLGQLPSPFGDPATAAETTENVQRAGRADAGPDVEFAGQVAEAGVLGGAAGDHAAAQHADLPARGPQQAHDAADRSGLARSVGAEIAEDLARLDRERHELDPAGRAVAFRQ
jgi:hypothetical protein